MSNASKILNRYEIRPITRGKRKGQFAFNQLYFWDFLRRPEPDLKALSQEAEYNPKTQAWSPIQTGRERYDLRNLTSVPRDYLKRFKGQLKALKRNRKYYLDARVEKGDDETLIFSRYDSSDFVDRHAIFTYDFSSEDVKNTQAIERFKHLLDMCLKFNYPVVVVELSPLPPKAEGRKLQVKDSININCMAEIIGNHYPRVKERAYELGHKMRQNGHETIEDTQQMANEFNHKYTFISALTHEVICVIKASRGVGNRNLNIYVHDGHAFSESLTFDKPTPEPIITDDVDEQLLQETNTMIRLYEDRENGVRGYRTSYGKWVVNSRHYSNITSLFKDIKNPLQTREAVYFLKWIELNQLRPTIWHKEDIRDATIECIKWASCQKMRKNQLIHYDRNSSFCSVLEPTNTDAYPWYNQYLIPQNLHLFLDDPTIDFVRSVSGIVICSYDLADGLHPAIVKMFSNHKSNRFTTPFIMYCYDNGIFEHLTIHRVIWGNHKVRLQYEDGTSKHNKRIYIGKCVQNEIQSTYYFTEKEHRDYHFHEMREKLNRNLKIEDGSHWYTLDVPVKNNIQYIEVRAFIMSYQAIAMINVILKYSDHIYSVGCDNLHILKRKFNEPLSQVIGEWKIEERPYARSTTEQDISEIVEYEIPEPTRTADVYGEYMLKLLTNRRSLQMGKPGYGKSYQILEALVRLELTHSEYVYLTPTKKLSKKLRKKYPTLNIVHWQKYFCSSHCDDVWLNDESRQLKSLRPLIIWDEIFTVDSKNINGFMDYLNYKRQATVIMIGDNKQLTPFDGYDNTSNIILRTDYVASPLTVDYRSKNKETSQFKDKIRGIKTEEESASYLRQRIGDTSWADFLRRWTPDSLVYASTRNMGKKLNEILENIHNRKFKKHPKPYIFKNDTVYCTCCEATASMDCENAERFLEGEIIFSMTQPPNTRLSYTSTIHTCIGDTVQSNVFLFNDRNSSVFCNNGIYTAITRIERMEQLFFVLPDDRLKESAHTVGSLEDQIKMRIHWHTQYDKKKGYTTDLNSEGIKSLVEHTPICRYCKYEILHKNCHDKHDELWSINRVDNKKGHTMDNIEICCRSCNIHKRIQYHDE
jgi:hypothetical protein